MPFLSLDLLPLLSDLVPGWVAYTVKPATEKKGARKEGACHFVTGVIKKFLSPLLRSLLPLEGAVGGRAPDHAGPCPPSHRRGVVAAATRDRREKIAKKIF